MLELRLIEQGFETKTARSAEQALKILAETPMDAWPSASTGLRGFDLKHVRVPPSVCLQMPSNTIKRR